MDINVKQAEVADAKALSNITRLTFALAGPEGADAQETQGYISEYLNDSAFKDMISDENIFVGCAQTGKNIAGFFVLKFGSQQPNSVKLENCAELQRLYVLPEFHGSHVAKSLVLAAFEVSKVNDMNAIWLCVFSENKRAKRFYEKYGFNEVGSINFKMGSEIHLDTVMVADVVNRQ